MIVWLLVPRLSFRLRTLYDVSMVRVVCQRLLVLLVLCVSMVVWFGAPVATTVHAASSGDFNNDGQIDLADYKMFVPALHTSNAAFSLIGADTFVDLFDYNTLLTQILNPAGSTSGVLKVMTYNVLYNSDKDANFHKAKMATLAQYLKDNKIEIIGLQEMLMGKNDMVYLRDALNAINYPMPYVADGQDLSGDFRNVLFSKYKINNFKEVPVSGGRSVLDMDIDTPLGNYTVLVMHVIHTDPCGSFKKDIIPLLQAKEAKNKNIIFMGDMNLTFYNSWCDVGPHREQYYFSCFNPDGTRTCADASFSTNSMIDYIAINRAATAQLTSSKVETTLSISDHRPVVATIALKAAPTPVPTAVPTPTLTPTPSAVPGIRATENVKVVKNIIVPIDNDLTTSINANLEWYPTQTGNKYTVFFAEGDSTPDAVLVAGTSKPNYNLPRLKENTTYFWQVETIGSDGSTSKGPVRKFTTEGRSTPADVNAMVTIPDGEFKRGCDSSVDSNNNKCNYNDEWHIDTPLRTLWIDAFKLDKYEVTNQEYRRCVTAGKCAEPGNKKFYDDPASQNDPVVFVSNFNAQDYCAWEGKRLPTEAEWEKAARGAVDTRLYPWGNEKPTCDYAQGPLGCPIDKPVAIGGRYLGASPYGARDMAGNVFEWVHDKYISNYYEIAPAINPQGPANSRYSVSQTFDDVTPTFEIRGGGWRLTETHYLRVSHRHYGHHGLNGPFTDAPNYRNDVVGFRCAQTIQ